MPIIVFQSFFVIFPWLYHLETVRSLSVSPRVLVPGIEECENYWYVKTSVDIKKFWKIKSMQHVLAALQKEKSSSYSICIYEISLFGCPPILDPGAAAPWALLCTLLAGTTLTQHKNQFHCSGVMQW